MTDAREWLVQWLRDAHAMEEQAETMLNGLVGRLENYPGLSARIEMHIRETKSQAARLEQCLDRLGETHSGVKDAGAKIMAMGQAMSGMFAGDEVMKGSLASFSFEAMEIASYTMLIAAARTVNEEEIAQLCEQNLQEEIEMAQWLKENLGATTQKFLALTFDDSNTAKR